MAAGVRDFESLLQVSKRAGLDQFLRHLVLTPTWEEHKENFLKDTDLLRRTYREFGREVNHEIGDNIFSVGF